MNIDLILKISSFFPDINLDLKRIYKKFSLSIFDQFLSVFITFSINILLARYDQKENYGYFVLSYSLFTFLLGIYNSLILDAYTVFGSGKFNKSFKTYSLLMFKKQLYFSVLITAFIFTIISYLTFFTKIKINLSLWGLTFALSFLFLSQFIRRTFYIQGNIRKALIVTSIVFITVVLGEIVLLKINLFNGLTAFILLGIGWLIGTIYFIRKENYSIIKENFKNIYPTYIREHWNYSSWIILTAFVFQLTNQGYYWLASGLLAVDQVGNLKAVQNIISPVDQLFISLSLLTLPLLAKTYIVNMVKEYNLLLKKILFMSIFMSSLYAVFLWFFGPFIIHLLYKGKYDSVFFIIYPLSIIPIIMGIGNVFNDALKARQITKSVFIAYVISGIVTLTLGIFFIKFYGLLGITYGMIASALAYTITLIISFLKKNTAISLAVEKNEPLHV